MKTNIISSYWKYCYSLASNRYKDRVRGTEAVHDIAMYSALFSNAKSEVRMYVPTLATPEFKDQMVINAIETFLNKPGSFLWILYQENYSLYHNPALRKVLENRSGVQQKLAVGTYAEKGAKFFTVADNCGYVFKTGNESETMSCFNEPETAEELVKAFDTAYEMGKNL